MYKIFTCLLILSLVSCWSGKDSNFDNDSLNSKGQARTAYIERKCIKDRFAEGHSLNVYGVDCLEGRQIIIETSNKGELVSTSEVSESATGLKLEGHLSFKNKFYNTSYDIKENEGDAKEFSLLLNFLPSNEEFTGNLKTKYHIIFKTLGNYLVLFKATQNLNDLPDIERTSLKALRNNEIRDYDSSNKKEGDFYMVPFIGYPITYCQAKSLTNSKGERTFESTCEESLSQNTKYVKVNPNNKQNYKYLNKLKKDLFPSNYFEGEWYFSEGPIETPTREAEQAPYNAYLVTMEKEQGQLNLKDMSGDVEYRNRRTLGEIPVKWRDFEINKKGNHQFEDFGEKEKDRNDPITRPYAQIDFRGMKESQPAIVDLIDLTISPDYFSYIQKITINDPSSPLQGKTIKKKTSFLRAKTVDTTGFIPRRWFINDNKNIFGYLWVSPQDEGQRAEVTESERLEQYRMIRFNTSLNTEKETKTKTKTIEWHFSKNSTKDIEYREVAQKAVDIYNQAFKHITQDSDKKIEIKLAKKNGEYIEKDLGDLRYNIINLVKATDLSGIGYGLLGVAPSYVNPDTGQIIGTTANIFIHTQEETFDKEIRAYIRYEIFQKERRTKKENQIHVLSPFLREQIQKKCPEVNNFIQQIKKAQVAPRAELSDKQIIISCGKKLTKQALLGLILHEMGHSFGLGHNFKASVDKKNYYGYSSENNSIDKTKTEREIKTIFPHVKSVEETAHFSSVMDYGKHSHPELTVLGKYDLAALRYLYLEEIELKNGSKISLKINPDPNQQKPLTARLIQNRKNYMHCDDSLQIKEALCYPHDYGSTPAEIAEDDILYLKRSLNKIRYRYDLDEELYLLNSSIFPANPTVSNRLAVTISISLSRSALLYNKWEELKNNYLESLHLSDQFHYVLNDQKSIDEYKSLLKKGLNNKEYALYYPVRDILPKIVMELMSLEEMTCHVKDSENREHHLILETIKNLLRYDYGDSLYVEDCYSPIVSDFFRENDLTLINQSGYENFTSYYPQTSSQFKWDTLPISHILVTIPACQYITANGCITIVPPGLSFILLDSNIINAQFTQWLKEPDWLKTITETAQANLLNLEKNKTVFSSTLNSILLTSAVSGLHGALNSPDKKHILTEHLSKMGFVRYKKGTGPDSFYKKVIEPLSKGLSIENIEVPFLTEIYKQYQVEQSQLDFLSYLEERKDIFHDTSEQIIIIPFKTNSFSEKIIRKYNETLKKLKKMEERRDLSAIEELNKSALKQYNQNLYNIIN